LKKKKTLPKLLKEAERVFNTWIRNRDRKEDYFHCINCGHVKRVDELQAGHLIPVNKSSFLRFNEFNVNGECAGCNCYDDAKVSYTMNLIKKIGHEKVQWLIDNKRSGYKWSRDELETLIEKYKL
jgi:hypothetical protein